MPQNITHLRLYENCRGIPLDDDCWMDAHERVGLLTVIVGAREVALFLGIDESDRSRLGRVFRHSAFTTVTGPAPTTAYTWETTYPPPIVTLFRKRDPKSALWLCRNLKVATSLTRPADQITVGRLLGYPECCIGAHQVTKGIFESAVIAAYIRACGEDAEQIADALVKNRKVEMKWKHDKCLSRATARFPFVQHVACEECLTSESSPSGLMNSAYGQLVEELDHHLYDYVLRIAERSQAAG